MRIPAALALVVACATAAAFEERAAELAGGETLRYVYVAHAPEAALRVADEETGTSALATAVALLRRLAEGRLEEAALLSNAPKARYTRLRESFAGWSAEDFRRTWSRYLEPPNGIVGEARLGAHRLILWRLEDLDRLTGFFFVEIGGRVYLDDVPSAERSRLRRLLEALRGAAPEQKSPVLPPS